MNHDSAEEIGTSFQFSCYRVQI